VSPSSRRRRNSPPPTRPSARTRPVGPDPVPLDEPDGEVDEYDDDADEFDDEDEDDRDRDPSAHFWRLNRLAPAAGVAYALIGFVGASLLPIGDVEPEDPASQVAARFAEDRGRISAGILLTMLSLFFLMVFVAWLHRWLRDVEGRGGWLATLAAIGGTLMAGMMLVVVMLSIAGTVLEGYGDDPVIARTLIVLQWQAVAVVFIPTAVFIGATSMVGLASGEIPKWLTYSGLAIALGLLLPPIAFLPFLFSTMWTGLLAVLMLQKARYAGI
jgi:hypothetical protein